MSKFQPVWIVMLLSASAALQAAERALPEPGSAPWQPEDHGEVQWPDSGRVDWVTVGPDALACDYTDLQAAIDNVDPGTLIRLARNINHSGRSYTINQRSLTIRGGFATCSSATPSGRTTIDVGGTNAPVITVSNAVSNAQPSRTVHLENLALLGAAGINGAGLRATGTAGRLQVNLRNVLVRNNQGVNGAGVRIESSAVATTNLLAPFVSIDNDSEIRGNTAAANGGGIYLSCESQGGSFSASMLRVGTSLIHENSAQFGGALSSRACRGIFIYGGGELDLLGNKVSGLFDNVASVEGGVFHAREGAEINVLGRAVTGFGDASQAVLIRGNSAANWGGVAALNGVGTILYLEDSYLLDNQATAAGLFDLRDGARVDVGRFPTGGACLPVERVLLAERYPPCSVIAGNNAVQLAGVARVLTNSELNIWRTLIRDNSAELTSLIIVSNAAGVPAMTPARVRIEGSLIHDNLGNAASGAPAGRLFHAIDGAQFRMIHSTMANNQLSSGAIAMVGAAGQETIVRVNASVIQEQQRILTRFSSPPDTQNARIDCVIGNRSPVEVNQDFDAMAFYSQTDPRFANVAQRDYRLRDDSPAIDYCDGIAFPQHPDFDGNERGVPWLGGPLTPAPNPVPNGLWDIGAFEAQPDRIFRDRFQ